MLRKKERLKRSEFNRFFAIGKRLNSGAFQLISTEHPTNHTAVVVSKKVAKTAVSRNRLRRRVYAIVEREFREKQKGVLIFIAKKEASILPFAELKREVTTLVGRAAKIY